MRAWPVIAALAALAAAATPEPQPDDGPVLVPGSGWRWAIRRHHGGLDLFWGETPEEVTEKVGQAREVDAREARRREAPTGEDRERIDRAEAKRLRKAKARGAR